MKRHLTITAALAVFLAIGESPPVHAQQSEPITDAAQAGVDFQLQGEYVGRVSDAASNGASRGVGLQVVALGEGRFKARMYPGGLPGAGWDRSSSSDSTGERDDRTLTLDAGAQKIRIVGGRGAIMDSAGRQIGMLQKTNRISPTLGWNAPKGADVVFNGEGVDMLTNGRTTPNDLLMEGADFKKTYRDYTLHLEFRLPYMPAAGGQRRANSGVYLQSRYEVQILDSFGLDGAANECGALYKLEPPLLNMCYPPLSWQTYDIQFTSPRFDEEGNKTDNARITVLHNGVIVHNDFEIPDKTGNGKPETEELLPIRLQNHGDPVRFTNIWILDHESPAGKARLARSRRQQNDANQNTAAGGGRPNPGLAGYGMLPPHLAMNASGVVVHRVSMSHYGFGWNVGGVRPIPPGARTDNLKFGKYPYDYIGPGWGFPADGYYGPAGPWLVEIPPGYAGYHWYTGEPVPLPRPRVRSNPAPYSAQIYPAGGAHASYGSRYAARY